MCMTYIDNLYKKEHVTRLSLNTVVSHLLLPLWQQCPLSLCPRSLSYVQTTQLPPVKGDLLPVEWDSGCKSLALLSHISTVPDDRYGTSVVIQDGFTSHLHQLAS